MKNIIALLILAVVLGIGYQLYVESYKGALSTGGMIVEDDMPAFVVNTEETSTISENVGTQSTTQSVETGSFVPKPVPATPPVTETVNNTNVETTVDISDSGITTLELAKHNSAQDCWIVYGGKVFDVTMFLSLHPGGPAPIARFCGIGDSSFATAFEKKHHMKYVEDLGTQAGVTVGELNQ